MKGSSCTGAVARNLWMSRSPSAASALLGGGCAGTGCCRDRHGLREKSMGWAQLPTLWFWGPEEVASMD